MKINSNLLLALFLLFTISCFYPVKAQNQDTRQDIPFIPLPDNSSQQRLYRQMVRKNQLENYRYNQDKQNKITQNTTPSKDADNQKEVKQFPYIQEDLNPIEVHQKKSEIAPAKVSIPKTRNVWDKKNVIVAENLAKANDYATNSHTDKNSKKKADSPLSRAENFQETWDRLLQNSKPVPGFDHSIEPVSKGPYRYSAPDYYRGIYLNNATAHSTKKFAEVLKHCKKYDINVLVIDVQPRIPSMQHIKLARESGIYLVARIVVFPGGLSSYPPTRKHIDYIANRSIDSAKSGFMEIQLDYIRFTDYWKGPPLSKSQRYRTVATILKHVTSQVQPYGLRVGADIFGRIPFNVHDRIGQNMEIFANYLDTIYPMLYPSHFYGDKKMQNNPYLPVYQGTLKSVQRVGHKSKIIPYIQAFNIHVKPTKLTYVEYIYKQLQAAQDSGGSGFIAWNAGNHYSNFYKALKKFDNKETNGEKNP